MADIFDQIAPEPLQGAKPTPSKGLKFNDSSAAGAPQAPQTEQVNAQTPSTGDIFDKIAPNEDIFDQLQPEDSHYRQLYVQQKAQGLSDVAHGAWEGIKALGKTITGAPAEVGQAYGDIEASAEQNPLGFQQSEGARRLRATALEGAAQIGRNYLNMVTKDVPSAEELATAAAGGGGMMSLVNAQISHEVNKPGGMVRNLLKKTGIINPTPEQEEAEYQAWKQNQLNKEELEKTPAAPAALQNLVSGGAKPLPETTAAVSMLADPLNYLSLGVAPAAQALSKVEAGMKTASAAEKAAQMAGNVIKTGGNILEKTGELPETLASKAVESALGPQASEAASKFVSGAKVASVPLAVLHGGTPEVVSAALEGAKRAGKALSAAGEVTTALAEADRNNPFGRLAALAKDPDAPEWMRYAASSPLVKAVAPVASATKDITAGTAHGAAIGAALGSANADTPEELGQNIGQMAAIGGAGRVVTLPMQNRARVMQKMADAAAELYHQHVSEGVSPETLKKVGDSTMMNAAAAQKMFGDAKVRFLDGESGQFADQAKQSGASQGSAGFWDPTARTIYLNADSGRGADTTLLHELTHPLFDSVVANRPELKAQIDSSLQRTGKTLDQAKQDYAQQVVGEHGFSNREDFDRATTQFIDRMDKGSQALHSDQNHWIYSELMAEAGMKAMKGKNLVTDIINPSLSSRAVLGTKSLLEGLGVKFKEGQNGKTILPNFEDTITSPDLRKSTYSLLKSMKDYRPGIDEPETQGVKITPETMGQHPGAPLHVLPNGELGNDFMAQSASGKAVARPNKDIRKIVKNRRAEVNAAFPLPQTEAPLTQDPQLQWRKTPSGLSERSGTTLGPDFDKLRTFNDDTKAKAKDLENAIANGEARQGWYQQVGEGPDWRGSVSRDTGNVTAQHKQFQPINFHVDKAGNVLIRNYSLGAFNDKSQVWAGRHGPLSLDLWDGNIGEFKKDVATYLDNHKNNLAGDTSIGEAKKNAINAFLVGKNVTWEKANPLRVGMRGSDTQGVVRSYRLDRLETLAPHETEFAKPDYAKQVKNLSPEAKPAPEYPKPEDRPAYEQEAGALDRLKGAFAGQGIDVPSMSPDTKKPTVMVKGPDGVEHPFWYDGSADWGKFGKFHQFTAQEDVPGLTVKHSSITDKTLSSKGYTWELPKEEAKPAAPGAAKEPVSMSPDEPKTFMVRHGSTEMNNSDPDKDLIRGHIDIPLDKKGRSEARAAGKEIASKGGVDHIVTSDLSRAVQTARAIAAHNPEATIETDPRLRPWKFGPTIEGKPTSEMLPKIKELTDNPDTRPPGGETFNEFKQRFLEGYHDAQTSNADKNTAMVTHYRGTKLMDAWRAAGVDNDNITKEVFEDYDKNKKPGNVQVLNKAGEEAKIEPKKAAPSLSPDFVHYSNEENLKTLEPEKHGTGLLGAEAKRKRDYPEIYQPRASFDVTSGKAPTKGFATSLYPDRTQLVEKGQLTPETVKDFAKKNADLLAQPDHVIGTWSDKESGKTYLDVSYIAPNENIAKHAADMFNQKAYWDIKGQKEVKAAGNGETMENMPPALERVPQAKAAFAKTQELPKGEVRGPVQVALPEGTDNSKARVRTVRESQHLDLEALKNAPDTEGYRKKSRRAVPDPARVPRHRRDRHQQGNR